MSLRVASGLLSAVPLRHLLLRRYRHQVVSTFTDLTLTAGSTAVKAVHATEIRSAINGARTAPGFNAISFTNVTLTAGSSTISAVDVTEMRSGVQ